MPDINLSPYAPETAAVQRRLQMAQLLSQQAMQPMELPQQAGVRASHYGGLAKILQGYMAGKEEKGALEEYKNLAEKYQGQNQADLQNFLGAVQGTPQKEFAGPAPQGAPQPMTPEGETGGYIQPGQAPDRTKAMALALGSQNSALQGAGGAMLSQMFAQDKIKDFKMELVNGVTHRVGLTETGRKIDLGPAQEAVGVDTAARLAQEEKLQGDRLKQERELSDRAFNGLSANQKATLANEGARLGISAADLYFNTGMKAGGVPSVGQPMAGQRVQPTQSSYTPLNNVQSSDQNLPPKFKFEQMKNAPNQENTLRDEYNSLTKDFRIVQDAHSKIKNVANTGAGDMSLLYSYVKLLDPGSVVRESEFATAAASGSFGERIQGMAQRVLSGQRLPPDLRTDFIREADSIYTSQKSGADRLENQYRDIAKRNNLNPENIIVNYASPSGTALPPITSLKEDQITTFSNGQSWTLKNGKQVQVK
jgi:hypothetical protein